MIIRICLIFFLKLNVVFPTGTSLFNDTLYIYYGAADKRIACVSVSLKELLKELLLNTTNYEN